MKMTDETASRLRGLINLELNNDPWVLLLDCDEGAVLLGNTLTYQAAEQAVVKFAIQIMTNKARVVNEIR